MKAIFAAILIASVSAGDISTDLQSIGVPVFSAELLDSMLVVSMSGTLTEGDSLLKHYGGVFFTTVDSIAAGWDICGIAVELDEATLVFRKREMVRMFEWVSETTDDESIAEWVLNHTRVVMNSGTD